METAYLSLGSNIGDRLNNLKNALKELEEAGVKITAASSVYESESWGGIKQPDFLNACVKAETGFKPMGLLETIKGIEAKLGRKQDGQRWGPRIIDIDIIFYGKIKFESDRLKIPHRSWAERLFVLAPLSEIAPDFVDPETGISVADKHKSLTGSLRCERIGTLYE